MWVWSRLMGTGSVAWLWPKWLQRRLHLSMTVPLFPAVMKYSFSLLSHPGQFVPLGSITTDSTPWWISSQYSVNPFSSVQNILILPTCSHTFHSILVLRIWYRYCISLCRYCTVQQVEFPCISHIVTCFMLDKRYIISVVRRKEFYALLEIENVANWQMYMYTKEHKKAGKESHVQ